MKLLKSPLASFAVDPLMLIDNDTFMELIDIKDGFMVYKVRLQISLQYPNKNPKDYERIIMKIKKDPDFLLLQGYENTANLVKDSLKNIKNPVSKTKKMQQASMMQKMSDKTASKINAGINMLNDYYKTDETLVVQKDIPIPPSIPGPVGTDTSSAQQYTYTEVYEPDIRPVRAPTPPPLSEIDSRNVIQRINSEKITPSFAGATPFTSENNLYDTTLIEQRLKNLPKLYLDYARYFLYEVPKSQFEDYSTWYESRIVAGPLRTFELTADILIPIDLSHAKFDVVFELYKRGTSKVQEIQKKKFNCGDHFEAKKAEVIPPQVTPQYNKSPRKTLSSVFSQPARSTEKTCNLSIVYQGQASNISGFNIYSTPITKLGSVESSFLLGKIPANVSQFSFNMTSKLSVIRVVPISASGEESHVFTEVVVGNEFEDFGNLTIVPYKVVDKRIIRIDVYNIPKKCNSISLFRRDCTNNPDANFDFIREAKIGEGIEKFSISDPVEPNKIFEYYAVAEVKAAPGTTGYNQTKSNYVFFKHPSRTEFKNPIVVQTTPPESIFENGNLTYRFGIKSTISDEENKKITDFIRDLAPELYNYFLSPDSNVISSVPRTDYSDVVMHEVIRTNLNTAERESFGIVSDGLFEDNDANRKKSNAKHINPQHDYLYQVFSYKRNPITLFKDYIAYGVENGKEWFFSPYKWQNPTVTSTGKLYPQDVKTQTPIIDAYEAFTSECYGMTSEIQVQGAAATTSLSNISAKRIDINTVKISWSSTSASSNMITKLYDSFVVMKVVNGVRSFVGRTQKSFTYHQLTPADLGSVYYIIVPIIRGYDIDEPGYSNEIYISAAGLTPVVAVQPPPQAPPPQQNPDDLIPK